MAGSGEVWAFVATCPAGTTPDDPIVIDLSMPVREIVSIKVQIPPGPAGAMGWALGAAGQQVIPTPPTSFVITDNETFDYDLPKQIDSGAWQVQMWNVGQYDHSIYIYFTVQLPDAPAVSASGLVLPAETLGSAVVVGSRSTLTPTAPALVASGP